MQRSIIPDILIAFFILLFVYTGSAKLIDFPDNRMAMHNQPLAGWLIDFLVYAIPISELIVVVLLMFGRTRLLGLYLFTAMMIIFTGYVALILGNYYGEIPCSCAGLRKELSWTTHLYINILFTCMGIIAIYLANKKKRHPGMFTKPSSAG